MGRPPGAAPPGRCGGIPGGSGARPAGGAGRTVGCWLIGGRGVDPGVGRPLEMNRAPPSELGAVGAAGVDGAEASPPPGSPPETSACGFNVSVDDPPSDASGAVGTADGGASSETLELATVSEGASAVEAVPSSTATAGVLGAAAFLAAAFFAGAFLAAGFSPSASSASAFGAAAFLAAVFFAAVFFAGFSSSGCASRFSPSRSAFRRTRSACASSIEEETLRTSMPIDFERSRASLFVRPSSLASSAIRIFLAGKG